VLYRPGVRAMYKRTGDDGNVIGLVVLARSQDAEGLVRGR